MPTFSPMGRRWRMLATGVLGVLEVRQPRKLIRRARRPYHPVSAAEMLAAGRSPPTADMLDARGGSMISNE